MLSVDNSSTSRGPMESNHMRPDRRELAWRIIGVTISVAVMAYALYVLITTALNT